MRVRLKTTIIVTALVCVTLLLLFVPGLPWSARCRHYVKRTLIRAEMKLATWQGHEPRLMSIAGRLNAPAIGVQALDSRSGWATLTDREGRFVLPDVMWYPGATYDLVISRDESTGRLLNVRAPEAFPQGGVFNAGELDADQGSAVEIASLVGDNSLTREEFDSKNRDYYKQLFDRVTAGRQTDAETVEAINDFVASKLNYDQTQRELGTPRRVLEEGSEFCGHLSTAMETLLAVGGYRTRALHMSDGKDPLGTHVVVEVSYGGKWHLYDPTFGYKLQNEQGEVLAYKDVRLDTSLINEDLFTKFTPKFRRRLAPLLAGIYGTGYHHYYYFKGKS
jgi:Transglutaminase-like superfamily